MQGPSEDSQFETENWVVESIVDETNLLYLPIQEFRDYYADRTITGLDYTIPADKYIAVFEQFAKSTQNSDPPLDRIFNQGGYVAQDPYSIVLNLSETDWKKLFGQEIESEVTWEQVWRISSHFSEAHVLRSADSRSGPSDTRPGNVLDMAEESAPMYLNLDLASRLSMVTALSENQAKAITLRELGLTNGDIAKALGVEDSTVSSHLDRAQRKLAGSRYLDETYGYLQDIKIQVPGRRSRIGRSFYAPGGSIVTAVDMDVMSDMVTIKYLDGTTEAVHNSLLSVWREVDCPIPDDPPLREGQRYWNPKEERFEWYIESTMQRARFQTEQGDIAFYIHHPGQPPEISPLEYCPPGPHAEREQSCPTPTPMATCGSAGHEFESEPLLERTNLDVCTKCGLSTMILVDFEEEEVQRDVKCVFCGSVSSNSDWLHATTAEEIGVCTDCDSKDLDYSEVESALAEAKHGD